MLEKHQHVREDAASRRVREETALTRYVVAVSAKEAAFLAEDFGWDELLDAINHLADVKAPMGQYQVFEVEL